MERTQRGDDHHITALHVPRPCTAGDRVVAREPLSLALEDGVEMADQQEPAPRRARMHGHEMAGAVHRGRHLRPADGEAERPELGGEQIAHATHAFDVVGAARDVHRPLEECDVVLMVHAHVVAQPDLGGGEDGAGAWSRSRL